MKPLMSLDGCENQDDIIRHFQVPEYYISQPLCPYHHLSGILIYPRISTALVGCSEITVKGSDHRSTTSSHVTLRLPTSILQNGLLLVLTPKSEELTNICKIWCDVGIL